MRVVLQIQDQELITIHHVEEFHIFEEDDE
jgi:hypothetical protein